MFCKLFSNKTPKPLRNIARTGPEHVPNGSRTRPERVPNESRTRPERVPNDVFHQMRRRFAKRCSKLQEICMIFVVLVKIPSNLHIFAQVCTNFAFCRPFEACLALFCITFALCHHFYNQCSFSFKHRPNGQIFRLSCIVAVVTAHYHKIGPLETFCRSVCVAFNWFFATLRMCSTCYVLFSCLDVHGFVHGFTAMNEQICRSLSMIWALIVTASAFKSSAHAPLNPSLMLLESCNCSFEMPTFLVVSRIRAVDASAGMGCKQCMDHLTNIRVFADHQSKRLANPSKRLGDIDESASDLREFDFDNIKWVVLQKQTRNPTWNTNHVNGCVW